MAGGSGDGAVTDKPKPIVLIVQDIVIGSTTDTEKQESKHG